MASSLEFVKFAAEQLAGVGEISYRKMFGEYGIYCEGKIFANVCDDQLFVKITEAGKTVWPGLTEAPPYEGAKPYFLIADIENRERLVPFARATLDDLPQPKPKKSRKKS